jgi:hypothetical protein
VISNDISVAADAAFHPHVSELADPTVVGTDFREDASPERVCTMQAPDEMPSSSAIEDGAPVAGSAAPSASGYSTGDLALFKRLTGYTLDTRSAIWRAIDDEGNRVGIIDRLFTTLSEEAFRFADRQRRTGAFPDKDLTAETLALTLPPIRRAAAAVGSRGLSAFERLEAAIAGLKDQAVLLPPAPDADIATA